MASVNGIAKGIAEAVNVFRDTLVAGERTWSGESIKEMSVEFHRQLTQASLNDKTINFNR